MTPKRQQVLKEAEASKTGYGTFSLISQELIAAESDLTAKEGEIRRLREALNILCCTVDQLKLVIAALQPEAPKVQEREWRLVYTSRSGKVVEYGAGVKEPDLSALGSGNWIKQWRTTAGPWNDCSGGTGK